MIDPLHPLFSMIVEIVALKSGLTMIDLQKQLKARREKISVPTLYRTVGQMISGGVLVREAGKLSFSPTWVQEQTMLLSNVGFPVHKKKGKPHALSTVTDRSESLLMRKVRSFIGQRTSTADVVADDR